MISMKQTGISISGHVRRRGFDARTGKLIFQDNTPNLLVDIGLEELCDVLIGQKAITHCGVGEGTTEPEYGDLDLEIPIGSRIPVTDLSRTANIVLCSTFFTTTDCNGSWNEAILATEESGENIISHALFENTFYKNNTKTCYVDWTITIQRM